MPTYEYKCTECNERFEVEQSIHDDALTSLPGENHEHQLRKVFSPVGIAFKGDGFYRNDARGSSSSSGKDGGGDAPTKVSKEEASAASSDKPTTSDSSSASTSTASPTSTSD